MEKLKRRETGENGIILMEKGKIEDKAGEMRVKWLEKQQKMEIAKNGVRERIDPNPNPAFSSSVALSERHNERPVACINTHSDRSPRLFINPYLNLIPRRKEEMDGGRGSTWESQTCFSLLGDERSKSLIDLSIFKCTSAPQCVCVCVLLLRVLMRLRSECLSACRVC